jgi:hypothetical protein
MKKLGFSVLLLALILVLVPAAFAAPVQVGNAVANVCPEGDGWVKVDGLSGYEYTYTPPEGYVVTDNCYKHSTYVHYGSGSTVEADWHWLIWRYVRHELSHASFLLVPVPVEVCEDEAASNYGEEGECEYPEPTPEITPEITPTTPPDDNRPICLNHPDWTTLPSGWWRASKDQEPEFTAGFCYTSGPPDTGGGAIAEEFPQFPLGPVLFGSGLLLGGALIYAASRRRVA